MSNSLPTRSYYPALDGLRGVGCLLIVVYHNFPFLHDYLFFSWLAMDIFFVLSGFLITDILLSTFGEKNYLRNFYVRRLLRVFPLYYTALVLFLFVLPALFTLPVRIDYFVVNQVYFWTFTQNWLLIFHSVPSQAYLNHLWSMGVEEQFYLLWPLVFALIKKPKILLTLLVLLLVAFIGLRFWLWTEQIPGMPYYGFYMFTRIDGICIGCMVALMQRVNTKFLSAYTGLIVSGFAAVNFLFYLINARYHDSFPYLALVGFSTFSMIFGLLVHDIVNRNTRLVTMAFDIGVLKFLGRISYGTYIFHWPMFLLLNPYFIRWAVSHTGFTNPQLFSSVLITILAYLTGFLSYRYFELRFLRLKKYFA
jgi:peptidoglycan/LPS O-acetylase OafA/YrhL